MLSANAMKPRLAPCIDALCNMKQYRAGLGESHGNTSAKELRIWLCK